MTSEARREPERVIEQYLHQVPYAMEAFLSDPMYHVHVQLMRRLFQVLNMAMIDEEIPRDVRVRIFQAITLTLDEEEARQRETQRQLTIQKLNRGDLSDLLGRMEQHEG